MFHPDYNPIIAKLPKWLIKRAYYRLLHHSIGLQFHQNKFLKNVIDEIYLYHTLEVYEKGLNRKRKKQIQIIEPLENLSYNSKASVKKRRFCKTAIWSCDRCGTVSALPKSKSETINLFLYFYWIIISCGV